MCFPGPRRSGVRDRALKALDRLPPFSPVLNRLVAAIAHDDVCFADIGALIERDPVLASGVLRVANSALYGLRGTVNSVRHAVAVLGLAKLRNIALGMSMARMWSRTFSGTGWDPRGFNEHSVACGVLADLIAVREVVDYAEGAFVAGLLHDVGRMLLATGAPEAFSELRQRAGPRPWADCEAELWGVTHAELSGEALARWNLPAQIRDAVARHHEPGAPGLLQSAVREADLMAHALGHSLESTRGEIPDRLLPLLERFEAEFAAMKQLL